MRFLKIKQFALNCDCTISSLCVVLERRVTFLAVVASRFYAFFCFFYMFNATKSEQDKNFNLYLLIVIFQISLLNRLKNSIK